MIKYEFINYQNKLYYVYRKFKISHLKSDRIHDLMRLLECDVVVKNKNQQEDEYLFYLKEIKELDIIQ